MNIEAHRAFARRFGFWRWVQSLWATLGLRVCNYRSIKGMTLVTEDVSADFADLPDPYRFLRLTAEEFGRRPDSRQFETEEFIRDADARGDWCLAVVDGQSLASYGWYSNERVPVTDDFSVSFGFQWVYMYNGFTPPPYRGNRLHAFGMAEAARIAEGDGHLGLISYVEGSNYASLHSVARLGYRIFGTCYIAKILGRGLSVRTPGCRAYDFRVSRR